MIHHIRRHHHKIFHGAITIAVILSLIFGGTYGPQQVQAATYTFAQTNWGGGATTSTATHPGNQTSWTQYSDNPVELGLAGWWRLNEGSGTSAADSSGNNNTGTLSPAPTWTTGYIGQGLFFDAVDDKVDVGSASALDDLPAFTYAAWVNPGNAGPGGAGTFFNKGDVIFLRFAANGTQIEFRVGYGGGSNYVRTCNINNFGVWQHLVITWDGTATGSTGCYVNGASKTVSWVSDGSGSRTSDAASNLFFGIRPDGVNNYAGNMDEVRIYNRALSATEIAAAYGGFLSFPNSSASITLATSTASTTQTSDATTNSGFNLAGNTKSQVGVIGTGSGARVELATTTISWATTTIATPGGDTYSSIAIGSDGFARIVYGDASGIRFVKCTNQSCSTNSSSTIPSSVNGIRQRSLALDSSNLGRVIYKDGSDNLKFVQCGNDTCSTATTTTVGSVGTWQASNYGHSLALGSDGFGRITVTDNPQTGFGVRFIQCTNADCSTRNTNTVDGVISNYADITLGSDGFGRIAYRSGLSGSDFLKVAQCNNASCSAPTTTQVSASFNGYVPSIAMGQDDLPRVSYLQTNTSPNGITFGRCGNASCSSVTNTNLSSQTGALEFGTSIAVGSNGFARIAYNDTGTTDLELVTCTDADCTSPTITVVDSTSSNTTGRYPSMKIATSTGNDLIRTTYMDTTNGKLMFAYQYLGYQSSGTFTSGAIDTGQNNAVWDTVSWNATTTASTTVTVKVRSSANSDMSGATAFSSCSNATSSNATSGSAPGSCTSQGHRYVQYQATLTTTDTAFTPSLNDITLNYSYFPSGRSATLVGSSYDSADGTNIMGELAWDGDATYQTGWTVNVSMRTASSSANLSNVAWTAFASSTANCTFASGTITCPSSALPSAMTSGNDDRFFQYKVDIATTNTGFAPTINEVRVKYVVNAPPEWNQAFGTNGIAVGQNTTTTDSAFGKVIIQYAIRDPDTNTGTTQPGFATPTFQYNLGQGAGWQTLASSTLAAGDASNKAVAQVSYNTYTATWDAVTGLGTNTYSTTTQIRITLNDFEAANNTSSTTSAAFTVDTKIPTSTAFVINLPTSTITLATNDDSNIQYRVSSTPFTASSTDSWTTVGSNSTSTSLSWDFSGVASTTYPTIYLQVRDIYGNTLSRTVSAPYQPQSMQFQDVSNIQTASYNEFVNWAAFTPTSTASFGSYKLYRGTDGTTYSLLTTITAVGTNYYFDQGLSSSTTYYYRVQTVTGNGDTSQHSQVVTDKPDGQGGTDVTAPTITNVTVAQTQSSWARITWSTDELANAEVNYSVSPSTAFGSVASSTTYSTSHSITVTGLTASTTYLVRVRSTDPSGNTGSNDNAGAGFSFSTLNAPIISGVTTETVLDNSAVIFWNTNLDSDSKVVYAQNSQLSGSTEVGSAALVGNASSGLYQHRVTITGLTQGTNYWYYVKSTDQNNTTATDTNGNNYYTFVTTRDVKPPVISNISVPVKSSTAGVIVWVTDEPATSRASYGTASGGLTNATTEDTTLTVSHVASLTSLTASTKYYFTVTSKDASNNSSSSPENDFTTTETNVVVIQTSAGGGAPPPPPKDTTAPVITEIKVEQASAFGAMISFETNENSTGFLYYGEDTKYGFVAADPVTSLKHTVRLAGLKLGTEYHFQAEARDKDGNAASSPDKTFKTKFLAESVRDIRQVENAAAAQSLIEESIESILPSLIPPFIEEPRVSDVTESSVTIRWKTNVNSYSVVGYAPEENYSSTSTNPYAAEASDLATKTRDHEIKLAGLTSNTRYHYQVQSFTLPQVVGRSADFTFLTKTATIKPRIVEILNNGLRVVWNTDEPASSIVTYKNLRTNEVNQKTDPERKTDHNILIENLTPATSYEIKASGYNEKGNVVEAGEAITARTSQDVAAPAITNIKIDNALVPGRNDRVQTVVSWRTNEPATSMVFYQDGTAPLTAEFLRAGLTSFVTDHNIILTDLKPGQLYRVRVESTDEAGNKSQSPVRTIITPRQSESIVDIVIKNFEETFNFLQKIR